MRLPFGARHAAREHISVELLSAYLDQQVTAAERAYIEGHLAGCAACRTELERLHQTVTLLHSLPRVAVPRAFTLSEAQVGVRRRAGGASWLGGALRGLTAVAAVAAVALVVVVVGSVLQRPTWTPGETIARIVPGTQPAPEAPAAAPAMLAREAAPAAAGPTATGTAGPTRAAERAAQPIPSEPVEKAAERAAAVAAPATTTPAAPLRAVAPPLPVAPQPTTASQPTAQATPAPAPAPAVGELGIAAAPADQSLKAGAAAAKEGVGAELRSAVGAGAALPLVTPEALPARAPVSATLPLGAGAVYVDHLGLWALDREAGVRQLVQGGGLSLPVISPGRAWVAYRLAAPDNAELWAVRWNGLDARRLLAESDLPREDASAGYGPRYFAAYRWVPGKSLLALDVVLPSASHRVPSQFELWLVSAETGARQMALRSEAPIRPVYAPDGERFALLQRASGPGQVGTLFIYKADGTAGQSLLSFPMGTVESEYNSQLAWQPDGQGLWVAVPDATRPSGGMMLHLVRVDGQVRPGASIDADAVFWSPDATRLAYTRAITDSHGTQEIVLASADGSNAKPYALMRDGAFHGWSPDSTHFLYQDTGQVYVGSAGQAPRRLGNVATVFDPRWIAADQLLALHNVPPAADDPGGWMLVWRSIDGRAVSLQRLPLDVTFDVMQP